MGAALAHVAANQTKAVAESRSDLFGLRRSLVDDRAAYLDGEPGS